MRTIEILDCTLRDGGYVNNWRFGFDNIKCIVNSLALANIEYIECGFINNIKSSDRNQSIFENPDSIQSIIDTNSNSKFTSMMVVNKYDIHRLPKCSNNHTDVIRLAFHKTDINNMIDYAINIKKKGYKLFLQPTIIMSYSDEEIIKLLNLCNDFLKPDGVAIVDTLGEMRMTDIKKITKLFDKYLDIETKLIFHGHNNLQMAFSNAITFIENVSQERHIIVDSSLMGMGRDSGNVCTELLIDYLNQYYDKNYDYHKILNIIDNTILDYKKKLEWGYNTVFLLNAKNRVHPNYSKFFRNNIEKIGLVDLNYLINEIPDCEKNDFNENIARFLLNEFNRNSL